MTLYRMLDLWLNRLSLHRRLLGLLAEEGVLAYLVGGTVRDALLQRPSYDTDLAIDTVATGESAMTLGRRLADRLRGAYVLLDAERDVARVVLATEDGEQHVDLAALRGPDIVADLEGRDYTINAMAVPARLPWGGLIDPTGGERDLATRTLRMVGPNAYQDDPLRILRGIRLRAWLEFAITPQTEALMREWLPALARVSGERVRDEILLLLSCHQATPALDYGQALGAFQVVLPGSIPEAALTRGASAVRFLERHLPLVLGSGGECQAVTRGESSPLAPLLDEYAADLQGHWSAELSSGHPRWLLLKLAAWVGFAVRASTAPILAQAIMRRLRLSAHEERYLAGALEGAALVRDWPDDLYLGPLGAYRYYRRTGAAGVDGAILAAAQCAADSPVGAYGRLALLAAQTRYLLQAWFERKNAWVDPPSIVSGHDLISALGLKPGPQLGEWLERVREAQVQGLVLNKEQALLFVQKQR